MTKKKALLWIVVAYAAAIAAGAFYLFYAGEGNYLWHAFIADTLATLVIFVFSRSFKNSSFYDAYWSVIPPLLLLYWFYTAGDIGDNLRYYLIAIPLWFWAIRLTFNWAKHWQGIHHEDWRYPMVRDRFPKLEFFSDFFGTHYFTPAGPFWQRRVYNTVDIPFHAIRYNFCFNDISFLFYETASFHAAT